MGLRQVRVIGAVAQSDAAVQAHEDQRGVAADAVGGVRAAVEVGRRRCIPARRSSRYPTFHRFVTASRRAAPVPDHLNLGG